MNVASIPIFNTSFNTPRMSSQGDVNSVYRPVIDKSVTDRLAIGAFGDKPHRLNSVEDEIETKTDKALKSDFDTNRSGNTDAAQSPFDTDAVNKIFKSVISALEAVDTASEGAIEEETSDAIPVDSARTKFLGAIIQQYSGKELSFTEWSSLYQELETEGFDISKPLLDILL